MNSDVLGPRPFLRKVLLDGIAVRVTRQSLISFAFHFPLLMRVPCGQGQNLQTGRRSRCRGMDGFPNPSKPMQARFELVAL